MNLGKHYYFDLAAGLLAGFIVLLIGVVIWLGSQMGIRVTTQSSTGNTLGPFGPLTLVFSEAVDESLVTAKFFIQPEVKGVFRWVDARTLHFVPDEPFEPDTAYKLVLDAGPLTNEGALLKKSRSWTFRV